MTKLLKICLIFGVITGILTRKTFAKGFADLNQISSKTPPEIQQQAAVDVIARLLPEHWHLFDIQIDISLPTNTFRLKKEENDTRLQIIGSSAIAACKGFYHYFKYKLGGHVSWSGNRMPYIPANLPSIHYQSQSASTFIYYQNVCTWSYSYAWWKWADWRKHIDWMALMGISLTIAPIQEAVWTTIYREFGLSEDEISEHFAGAAFQAWQRMGNIRGWGGPLSQTYKKQQMALQKKILQAERELGITIALPAFAGHVPVAFRRVFPNATLTPVDCWNNFPADYCCPLFIDPNDDLFQELGSRFLREINNEYGTDHIYFSDPFNEIQPHKAEAEYLAQTARNIYKAMQQVDCEAVWLLQGWMFVKNPFWTDELLRSFLTAIPLGRMLILDLQSELFPQYERTNSYFGQPFIWCMLHNFGGTSGMHGSLEIVNTRIGLTRNMANSTMIGVGITMEGINQNDVMYEFALDRGWQLDNLNEKEWFDHFSTQRYGMLDWHIEKSNDLLRNSVYAYKGLTKLHGRYTIVVRPRVNLQPWTWYDHKTLQLAWTVLLQANRTVQKNSLYQQDVVEITRQFLQNKADQIYINIIHQYNLKNLTILRLLNNDMYDLFKDLESILATSSHFLLGTWLNAAKRLATNELESIMYEYNARNQITTWGPKAQINDYANKQWSGLVVDYYLPRWRMFLKDVELAVQFNRNFNEKQFKINVFRDVEGPFTYNRKSYPERPVGCSYDVAVEIHKKWIANYENEQYLTLHVPIK